MNKLKLIAVTALLTFAGACASGKPYTLDTCIVSDNELGSMGDPISYNHDGQEVKFCCKPCIICSKPYNAFAVIYDIKCTAICPCRSQSITKRKVGNAITNSQI